MAPVAVSTVRICDCASVPWVPSKATSVPSGEKSGNKAEPPSLVSCAWPVPSAFMVQISNGPVSLEQ